MPISKTVRKELDAEKKRLFFEMQRVEVQLEALQIRCQAIAEVLSDDPTIVANNGFVDMGLRDAIRAVLAEAGELKPAKVTRILMNRGFQFSGKTKPSVRVGNDLWKMAEIGTLLKNDNGEYSLIEDE